MVEKEDAHIAAQVTKFKKEYYNKHVAKWYKEEALAYFTLIGLNALLVYRSLYLGVRLLTGKNVDMRVFLGTLAAMFSYFIFTLIAKKGLHKVTKRVYEKEEQAHKDYIEQLKAKTVESRGTNG